MSTNREDILEILDERFSTDPRVVKGKMFGCIGYKIDGRFFCFLYSDGLNLKLSAQDYENVLKMDEAETFKPRGTPMGTWVTLTYPEAESYSSNWELVEKAMAYVVTDEAAPQKKRKKRANNMAKKLTESITGKTFDFMMDLGANNSKAWFDTQRERYAMHVRDPLKALAKSLSEPVSTLFPEFSGAAKVSRINNDIRFNPDKAPYKEHIWISFGIRGGVSDIFAAIDKNGWTAGCGLSSPKRDDLLHWRRNLIDYHAEWNQHFEAIYKKRKFNLHYGDKYKKPLFDDIPPDISELVQAKGIWIVFESKRDFSGTPEEDFMRAILQILPLYMFMVDSDIAISDRLVGIHATISNYIRKE